jgi:hypothetical protein
LEKSAAGYRATPKFKEAFRKLTKAVFFRIEAEPAWGLDESIIFGGLIDQGELIDLAFYSEADTKEKAELVLAATPQEWKAILTKERKFVGDVVLGKIQVVQGSKAGAVTIAPYSDTFVDALTQFELVFQDDMSAEEVEEYRTYVAEFRARLGV